MLLLFFSFSVFGKIQRRKKERMHDINKKRADFLCELIAKATLCIVFSVFRSFDMFLWMSELLDYYVSLIFLVYVLLVFFFSWFLHTLFLFLVIFFPLNCKRKPNSTNCIAITEHQVKSQYQGHASMRPNEIIHKESLFPHSNKRSGGKKKSELVFVVCDITKQNNKQVED